MGRDEEGKDLRDSLSMIKSNIQDSPARSPNTSQQLGKYITNGLEMLSLSDMKIVVHRPDFLDNSDLDDLKNESTLAFDDISIAESIEKEDCVYLANIYETYSKLNQKVDMLVRRDYFDKSFIKQVLRGLCNGEHRRVVEDICKELKERDPLFSGEQYQSIDDGSREMGRIIKETLSPRISEAKDELQAVEGMVGKLRRVFFEMRSRNFEMELNYSRTSSDLSKQLAACSKEIEDARRSRDAIIGDVKGIARCAGIEIERENDANALTGKLRDAVMNLLGKVEKMEKENQRLMANAEKNSDVDVTKGYEEAKREIQRLHSENIVFSEAITKLSEKNAKLKKDCTALNGVLKKINESSKRRNVTIDKQKRIIDILQSKMGSECALPMNELQMKIGELKKRIDDEMDADKRRRLVDEIADYERRMADFLSLLKKESN